MRPVGDRNKKCHTCLMCAASALARSLTRWPNFTDDEEKKGNKKSKEEESYIMFSLSQLLCNKKDFHQNFCSLFGDFLILIPRFLSRVGRSVDVVRVHERPINVEEEEVQHRAIHDDEFGRFVLL